MSAILTRLKPSANSDISSPAAAIENPAAAATAIANSVNLQEDPLTDGFFSFATARFTALRAVKNILLVANARKSRTGAATEARSRVGVQVWEGTQWLLRDEDREVRLAYCDALLTWLKLETSKDDLHLPREGPRKSKSNSKRDQEENGELKLAKRVVSNASRKENKTAKSNFLRLLHLAIYDNAIEDSQLDLDILLLHLLLTNLTERLGVNAVRHGLPMIDRLQDDLKSSDIFPGAKARINIASLVHGYLWALSEKFDFETSRVGHEIHSEISHRKKNGLWHEKFRLPALPLDQIVASSSSQTENQSIIPEIPSGSLRPYKARADLVDEICTSYNESLMTPTTSPPSSPGRVFSVPALSFGYGYGLSPGPKPSPEDRLPIKVKDELLSEWSKDSVIAAVEKERSDSLSGSKTGTGSARTGRNFLTVDGVNGVRRVGSPSANNSPTRAAQGGNGQRISAMYYALNGGLGNLQKLQRTGTDEGSPTPLTASSSRDSTVRVTELKRALSGDQNNMRDLRPLRRLVIGASDRSADSAQSRSSSGSESMVSYSEEGGGVDGSALNLNAVERLDFAPAPSTGVQQQSPDASLERPRSSPPPSVPQLTAPRFESGIHAATTLRRLRSDPRLGQDVPPVPEIPSSLNLPGTYPRDNSPVRPSSSKGTGGQSSPHQPQNRPPLPPFTAPGPGPTTAQHLHPHPQPRPQEGSLSPSPSSTRQNSTSRRQARRRTEEARPGSRTVDLARLLERISVETDDNDELSGIGRDKTRGVAIQPPY